jgi:hypothetical protein
LHFFLCFFLLLFLRLLFFSKTIFNFFKAAYSEDIWQASYKSVAVFWETQGAIWHGHEIVGFENIPEKGAGLLIYYHAAFPIDFYYLHSKTTLYKNRRFKIVADKFLFKVPGKFKLCWELFCLFI